MKKTLRKEDVTKNAINIVFRKILRVWSAII